MASKDIRVPDLGNFKDVSIIDVLVSPGETVQVDTPLLTLETEKATMDVPSSDAGVVEKLHVEKGGRVSTGSLIATLKVAEGGASETAASVGAIAAPAAAKAREAPAAPAATPQPAAQRSAPEPTSSVAASRDSDRDATPPPVNEAGFAIALASPSVRKFARELGVDLASVRGTGQKGRITAENVKGFVKSVLSSRGAGAPGKGWPQIAVPDFSQFGPIEIKPLGRVQRISGPRLQASWMNLPHVTQFDEADITELEQTRRSLKEKAESVGIHLTNLAFIVRACVMALQRFPQFNSSLDESGENLVYKKYCHVGFAADTPQGLLVPVIRDADRMDIYETARTLADLADKARNGKLSAAQMQGGCFTISNLGGIGGTAFTPLINAPEVAILGVSRGRQQPVFRDGNFIPRMMLPLSLSYDHRVIDGAAGARFASFISTALSEPQSLLEAVP